MYRLLPVLVFALYLVPLPSAAFYSLDTFDLAGTHSAPASFASDGNGGFFGTTVDDKTFTQTPVANDLNIKLHKFAIDDAFFYVSDLGAFMAHSDLAAISIYFSLV